MDGILFGLADVLYDDSAWRRWVQQQLQRMGVGQQYHSLWEEWEQQHSAALYSGKQSFHEVFEAFLSSHELSLSAIKELHMAGIARKKELATQIRPLIGVPATLKSLQNRKIKLGIVTNSDCCSDVLRLQLQQLGIRSHFDCVVCSRDLNSSLHDETGFQVALELMKISPSKTVFVGSNRPALNAAKQMGVTTVQFNAPNHTEADFCIRRFPDLLPVLKLPSLPTTFSTHLTSHLRNPA